MNNPILHWALEILPNPGTSVGEALHHVLKLAGVLPERLKVNANPLESIFSVISLEQGKQTSISKRYIPWCDLDTKKIVYPKADNPNSLVLIPQDLEWERFQSDYNLALVLLEKYGTYLSISPDVPHISFYDFVKSASAIHDCLTKGNHDKPFLLISGDFSGIQDSIYAISSSGALKTLRARSFMLELLTEHIVYELLQATDSQRYSVIFSGGGGFSILIPNTAENQNAVSAFGKIVNDWLLQQTDARLFLALHCESLSSGDLESDRLKEVWELMAEKLDQQKRCKFFEADGFKGLFQPELPKQLTNQNACQITRRDDLPDEQMRELEGIGRVSELAYHLWYLGDQLTDFDCIVRKPFFMDESRDDGTLIFPTHKSKPEQYQYAIYRIDKIARVRSKNEGYDALWLINNWNLDDYAENNFPFLYGDYVRTVADLPHEAMECEVEEYQKDWGPMKDPKRVTASFSDLAAAAQGASLIGCLRMDVDNSGSFFSQGISNLSIAAISNLSRSLNIFFKGYLNEICRGNIGELVANSPPLNITGKQNYPYQNEDEILVGYNERMNGRNVSVIYSGGDDLFIVGAWDEVSELAFDINACFKEFTCHNADIHISGGLTLHKPKFPLYQMARLAKQAEEAAKSNTNPATRKQLKNSIALFYNDNLRVLNEELKKRIGEMYDKYGWKEDENRIAVASQWEELEEVITLTKQLHQIYEHIPHGFYQRLFETVKIWQKEGLLYMPTMNHILRRMQILFAEKPDLTNLTAFMKITSFQPDLMRKLHIPLFWVEYLNRHVYQLKDE